MYKIRCYAKMHMKVKSGFNKPHVISKISTNTQRRPKEIFSVETLEKADEVYEKIRIKTT